MPTYEYTCKNCGETIEVFQSFSDKPLKKHKECGGSLQKVFHARGIVFKGGGFYATDSKAPAAPKKSSDSTSESKPAKEGSTSESKPTREKSSEKAAATSAKSSSSSSEGE